MSHQSRSSYEIDWPNAFFLVLVILCASLIVVYPPFVIALGISLLIWFVFRSSDRQIVRLRFLQQAVDEQQILLTDNGLPDPETIHVIAQTAMMRAGHYPGDHKLRVDDIGLLVYEGSTHPKISRLTEIPSNATHIRPFVVLDQPAVHSVAGSGIIGFTLIDEHGNLRFSSRSRYQIEPGQNFLTPPTWFPLADQNPNGIWSIAVNLGNNRLLAVHNFGWLLVGGEVRAQFTGDGEISLKLRRLMENPPVTLDESVSLDDLLLEQVEESPLALHEQH